MNSDLILNDQCANLPCERVLISQVRDVAVALFSHYDIYMYDTLNVTVEVVERRTDVMAACQTL